MNLHDVLSDMGHDIAELGIDRVPAVRTLAAAVHSVGPVVAAVLASDEEPANARNRAFLRAAFLAVALSTSEQAQLMATLLDQTAPLCQAPVPIADPAASAPVLTSVG